MVIKYQVNKNKCCGLVRRRSFIKHAPHARPFPVRSVSFRPGSVPVSCQRRMPSRRCPRVLHLTICIMTLHLGLLRSWTRSNPCGIAAQPRPTVLPPRRLLPLGSTLNVFTVSFPSHGTGIGRETPPRYRAFFRIRSDVRYSHVSVSRSSFVSSRRFRRMHHKKRLRNRVVVFCFIIRYGYNMKNNF